MSYLHASQKVLIWTRASLEPPILEKCVAGQTLDIESRGDFMYETHLTYTTFNHFASSSKEQVARSYGHVVTVIWPIEGLTKIESAPDSISLEIHTE